MGTGLNSEEKEYTAREMAKIFDVTQQTIINRCKAGHYAGAVKRKSPYGEQWFIPKDSLNAVAHEIVPVVKIEQQLTLKDFETAFRSVLNPFLEFQQGIIEQNQKLQEQVAELSRKIENIEGRDHEILTQIHAMADQKKKTFWQRLFGQ